MININSHMRIREAGAIPEILMLLSDVHIQYDKNSELENLQQWPSTDKVAHT